MTDLSQTGTSAPDLIAKERINKYTNHIALGVILGLIIPIIHNHLNGYIETSYLLIAIEGVIVVVYLLNKKSHLKAPLFHLSMTLLLMATGLMLLKNGINNVIILIFPGILIVSSLTFSRRTVLTALVFMLAVVWVMGIMEMKGLLKYELSRLTNFAHLIDLSIILALSAFSVDLISRELMQYWEDLRKNADRLDAANKKLNEINLGKDKYFSIIAHDLRGPFQALLGISNILVNEGQELTGKERTEFDREMNEALKNQNRLLNSLLDWSRIQSGRMKFHPEQINASELVNEAYHQIRAASLEKKIDLIVKVEEDSKVFGDFDMLTLVFRNLISNAVKFSHINGQVTVKSERSNGHVVFSVADQGVGLSNEDLSKIFQFENTLIKKGTANETGTGLGLLMCSEIIDKHGGKIWANGKLNSGSIFYFTVPVSKKLFKFTNEN